MASERMNQLAQIVFVEQVLLRSLAAVLIYRETQQADDPEAELRTMIGQLHQTIDLYGIDRLTSEDMLEADKEQARKNVDAIAMMIPEMRRLGL